MNKKFTKFRITIENRQPFDLDMVIPRTPDELKQQFSYFFAFYKSVIIEGIGESNSISCMRLILGFGTDCPTHWGSKTTCYCSSCQEQEVPPQPTKPVEPFFSELDKKHLHALGVSLG